MKRIIKNSVTSSKSTDAQREYEYRKNIYLKRKHEFETLGEDDNNDVLSREEKMNIAKAEMDKVNPKSVKSAKDATFKNDKRLSTTSERYKGYLIVLDRGGDGYNVYDTHRELEDAGYLSKEAAKKFIDELVSESDDEIESSVDIDEETEDPKWICLDIKHVRDSDGMLTDYALYTTEDEDKYICMFGDVDAYPPDEMYADAEFDSEEEALEWFEDYTGPGDEEDEYDIYGSEDLEKNADSDDALWDVIDDEEFEFRGVQDVGYDNDGNIMVIFNHAISEDMIEPTAEELLIAFRQYGYPVHEWNTNGTNVFILSRGGILSSTDTDIEDEEDLPQTAQEYDSAKTSINSNKLPAASNQIIFI